MSANYPPYPAPPGFFKTFIEPPSVAAPIPPHNHVQATPSGHSFEMDDTPDVERIRLQHRTGTFIEMRPDGEVHKVYGNGFTIIVRDNNVQVQGNCNIYIEGDAYTQVKGNKTEVIGGDYDIQVNGNFIVTAQQQTALTSVGDTNIVAGAGLGGGLKINTGDYTYINGDLSVDGEITADKITSLGRVDALGVGAGLLGFVSVEGGLSIGIPGAIPLAINCAGPITSFTSVEAPLGLFGISSSLIMFDVLNTTQYDTHIHMSPKGPTSPPMQPFLEA